MGTGAGATINVKGRPLAISLMGLGVGASLPASVRMLILAVLGSALLTLSAKVQVPFWPVPMTMQTYAVLIIGAFYGWRLGAATVALYLLQGLVGLPVFAGAFAGPAYMTGPTGGYLIGFLAAAAVVGWCVERGLARRLLSLLAVMALGHAVIFLFGVGWLAALIGLEKAITVGLMPFWAATALKTGLAVATMAAASRALSDRVA